MAKDMCLVFALAIAVGGLISDVVSTYRNVSAFGLPSESNLVLRALMERNGVAFALTRYFFLRLGALILPGLIAWIVLCLVSGSIGPAESRRIGVVSSYVQAVWAGVCAAVWWRQGVLNWLFPLIPR